MPNYNPDGVQSLLIAVLEKAVIDYTERGDHAAKAWLLSEGAQEYTEALGLDHALIVARQSTLKLTLKAWLSSGAFNDFAAALGIHPDLVVSRVTPLLRPRA